MTASLERRSAAPARTGRLTGWGKALRCPGRGDDPAGVVGPQRGGVEGVRAAVAGDVHVVVEVADIARREVGREERVALSVVAARRTERRIRLEQRTAVVGVHEQLEVLVAQETAGRVAGLERPAG